MSPENQSSTGNEDSSRKLSIVEISSIELSDGHSEYEHDERSGAVIKPDECFDEIALSSSPPEFGLPVPPPQPHNIGSIALNKCNDVVFGSKVYYAEPVTIQQFVSEKKESKEEIERRAKRRKKLLIVGGVVALVLVLVVSLSLYFALRPEQPSVNESNLRIVTREEWGAKPATEHFIQTLPVDRVVIAHTVQTACFSQSSCTNRVQIAQRLHLDQDYGDIGYHWIIGGNGMVFEGRPWEEIGAHTYGWNNGSICIAFIGDFNKEKPTLDQLAAGQIMIKRGVEGKFIGEDYKVFGQNQLKSWDSPGTYMFEIIKTWPHWSDDIPPSNLA